MASSLVYSELPKKVEEDAQHLIKESDHKEKKSAKLYGFLKKHTSAKRQKEGVIDNLKHRVFFIDNTERPKKRYNMKRKCRHKLSSEEKKKLGLFKIPKEQNYESFLPLHNLWKDYMRDLIDFSRVTEENAPTTVQQKLLKADYHGAIVIVSKSKTPSLIGQTGIILQETKNVFKIVTKENKVKMIPKENSIFTVELDGFQFEIQGSQFRYPAAERVHRKFKFRPRRPNDL